MKHRSRLAWFLSVCTLSLCFGCIGEATPQVAGANPKSFKECVAVGGRILKSYPAQCVTADGMRFVDDEAGLKNGDRTCKDLCGNGRCEEVVCMALGCPCAETSQSCPQDCKG